MKTNFSNPIAIQKPNHFEMKEAKVLQKTSYIRKVKVLEMQNADSYINNCISHDSSDDDHCCCDSR